MRIIIPAKIVESKGGLAMQSPHLRLTGFGKDKTTAAATLERGVRVWCRTLEKQGLLIEALERAGLEIESVGDAEIQVEVTT